MNNVILEYTFDILGVQRESLQKKITYKPTSHIYWVDENMRMSVTQIPNHWKRGIPKKDNYDKNTITFNNFKRALHTRHKSSRLYGDLKMFQKCVLTKGNVNDPKASVQYFKQKGRQKS